MGLIDKIPPQIWDILTELLKGLLSNCKGKANEESVIAELRNPGRFSRRRWERLVKANVPDLTEEQLEEAYQRTASASQLELQLLVQESWGMF